MKKSLFCAALLCSSWVWAADADQTTLNRLWRDTAALLQTAPNPSDASLITRYHLVKGEGDVWAAPDLRGDPDPSPVPQGFFLISAQGLQAYIGMGKPSADFARVRCRPLAARNLDGHLCRAPGADTRAVAAFERQISKMLQFAD